MGVDLGAARVGVAVSDPGAVVATPSDTVAVDGRTDLAALVSHLARERSCDTVVIGLPRGLSGRDTDATRTAREVAERLRATGLRVELWDERLSSAEAERLLVQAGRSRGRRRNERDRVAAAIILQGWLDARRP